MRSYLAALSVAALLCLSTVVPAQTPATGQPGQGLSVAPGLQNPMAAGVPSGVPGNDILALSLKEAVARGLRCNLGVLLGEQSIRAAQGSRLRALSSLMPHLAAQTSETVQQVNLAAVGFTGFPGVSPVVGPFPVFDVRAIFSQSLLNLGKLDELRAGTENLKATERMQKYTRDLVVLICLQLYMQAVAADSRVEAAHMQLKTAQALHQLAVSRKNAGFVPGIEVLRAQVQVQVQKQRVIVTENDFSRQKLYLAEAIGLPLGQEFRLTDRIPYVALSSIRFEDALQEAYRSRGDYLSLQARLQAAELSRRAAARQRAPSLDLNANYGVIGQRPTMSHGSFAVAVSLRIPVFEGRETEARILAADAVVEQHKSDLESLRARIDYEIRSAFLDLKSSADRVEVAKSSLDLANEQVVQAQDRFAAGVASNIEVVLAQDTLALATENYIASLYAHSMAKAALAGAMGVAESGYEQIIRGK